MRIGELASWARVTPRTVRYYHGVGLLPEPSRTASGYREYAIPDLLGILRIRRLVGLGLRLDEIRRIVVGSSDQSLDDALDELDRRLAVQQRLIAEQRADIAALRTTGDDDPRLLAEIVGALATAVEADRVDVELQSWLLATVGSIGGMSIAQVWDAAEVVLGDAEQLRAIRSALERFAALADADVNESEVARLADDISGSAVTPDARMAGPVERAGVLGAVSHELAPAQARCLELMIARLNGGAA